MTDYNDAREQTKTFLDTYLVPANITQDDDSTPANIHTVWAHAEYPLREVFFGKNRDAVFTIKAPDSTVITDHTGAPMGYNEKVPIEIFTVNKEGITGDYLLWKCERELRRILEAEWLGTAYRNILRLTPSTRDMGGWFMYSVEYIITYERMLPNYTSGATLSYGTGFMEDFIHPDVVDDWTEEEGEGTLDSFLVETTDYLRIRGDSVAGEVYIEKELDSQLTQNLYKKVRVRFRTSGASPKAKVVLVFTDTSTQTLFYDEYSSTRFKTITSTVEDTAKIIAKVRLYHTGGSGFIDYDFIHIYRNDFPIPNIRHGITTDMEEKDIVIDVPGMSGNQTQNFGSNLLEVTCVCDGAFGPWTRQGENDKVGGEIFYEMMHNADVEAWQWFDRQLAAFKVRLVRFRLPQQASGDSMDWQVSFTLREYRGGSAKMEDYTLETYRTRWGLDTEV